MTATGADAGQSLTFAITAGDVDGVFAIDAASGAISVATPAALGAEGTVYSLTVTVTDGVDTLYTLDARGRIVSRLRLPVNPKTGVPPTIRETIATEDGAYLLIRRGDGQISLLKATS